MHKTSKVILLFLGLWVTMGVVENCFASQGRPPQAIKAQYELIGTPQKNVPVGFKVTFSPVPGLQCGSDESKVTAFVYKIRERGDTLSFTTWDAVFDENRTATQNIEVSIPDNDTFTVEIRVWCGSYFTSAYRTFITTSDEMEYHEKRLGSVFGNKPYPHNAIIASNPKVYSKDRKPNRDTLTVEQLAVKYNVLLDLKSATLYGIVKAILGEIPEASKTDVCSTCYIMDISLDDIYKLYDAGVKTEFTSPPPWQQYKEQPVDSLSDLLNFEGPMRSKDIPESIEGISLDHVDGLAAPEYLI